MNTSLTDQSIRLAAIKLISRTGYESMSLRQLALEAGINSSTLYLYYRGKRELLLTLILEYFQDLAYAWDKARPSSRKAAVQLQAFVAFHVRYHLLRREQALLGNMEFRSLDADEQAQVRQARRMYLNKVQTLLERGVAEGSLHCAEPKLMAHIILNMLTHASAWYQADGRLAMDDVVTHYSDLVQRMVRVGPLPASQKRPRALAS